MGVRSTRSVFWNKNTDWMVTTMKHDLKQIEFENVELYGIPALFTNLRLNRKTVPDGLYVYEVRQLVNGLSPATIERNVALGFTGTVVSFHPLLEDGQESRDCRNQFNFIGDICEGAIIGALA